MPHLAQGAWLGNRRAKTLTFLRSQSTDLAYELWGFFSSSFILEKQNQGDALDITALRYRRVLRALYW